MLEDQERDNAARDQPRQNRVLEFQPEIHACLRNHWSKPSREATVMPLRARRYRLPATAEPQRRTNLKCKNCLPVDEVRHARRGRGRVTSRTRERALCLATRRCGA